mgnify:CR=1 FL=1
MDNKNVFIAIALSMSVLLFWAAFFESPRPIKNDNVQTQKKTNENTNEKNMFQNQSLFLFKGQVARQTRRQQRPVEIHLPSPRRDLCVVGEHA